MSTSKFDSELQKYTKDSADFTYAVKQYVDSGKNASKRAEVDATYKFLTASYNYVKSIVANHPNDKDAESLADVADVDFATQTNVYRSI